MSSHFVDIEKIKDIKFLIQSTDWDRDPLDAELNVSKILEIINDIAEMNYREGFYEGWHTGRDNTNR